MTGMVVTDAFLPLSEANPESRIDTTVVVPAFNEEAGIAVVLEKLLRARDDRTEILVVDDGSTDETAAVARRFDCRLVMHERNGGKAEAMRTGIREARGESIIFVDADDTYPVERLGEMAAALRDYDMVVGSRVGGQSNIPAFNRIGNAIFRNSIRLLYGFRAQDPLTGFYGVRKTYLERMRLESGGFRIESEIAIKAARMGLRTLDIPVEYGPRIGEAKLRGLRDGYAIFQTIVTMLILYSPTAAFVLPGSLIAATGLGVMAVLIDSDATLLGQRLGFHSFVLAAMVVLSAWQLIALGVTLNLYGSAHKFTKPDWLTRLFLKTAAMSILAAAGFALILVSVVWGLLQGGSWLEGSINDPAEAKRFVVAASMGVLGLEAMVSSVFLTVFLQEARKTEIGFETE